MNKKIIYINLGILLTYMIGLTVLTGGEVMLTSIPFIGLHMLGNLIMFVVYVGDNRPIAFTYLLCFFLVLLIGFPSCLGLSDLAGGMRFI